MKSVFQKFTTHSKNALKNAFSLALSSGHKMVTPQHILYGLGKEKGSIALQILNKVKINTDDIKESLLDKIDEPHKTLTHISLAPATKKVIEKAYVIASGHKHRFVGTEHLLASIISVKDPGVINFFSRQTINVSDIQRQIDTILASTSRFPDVSAPLNYFDDKVGDDQYFGPAPTTTSQVAPSILEVFAINLTDKATQQQIDPVIGRANEIERLIQILSRRNKNNPLLLGDPGVGKTAIVEGLAKKIVENAVPATLLDKKIYTLDLSSVVAGTSFRGEFENRLKQIIAEVKKNPNIILFIDEIHNIIGAGSATGSMDAANILKPALARGEIRCIGATTTEDFKKYIESDPALERRFQPIFVDQPNVAKTIQILQGIKNNYEIYHQVKITDQAIKAAAELSERYIADRFLPDKAIDLIDEASSATKIKQQLDPVTKKIRDLESQIKKITTRKQEAVAAEKFDAALKLREQEQTIYAKLQELREQNLHQKKAIVAEITDQDIASVVSKITGVPLQDLLIQEKNQLLNLEKLLAKKVVSQDQAVKSIAEFIRRSRTGIADAARPIGSFMFLGPSGVGKTELAKTLAEVVFGNKDHLIKIDMSEFTESFNISKLIGAPAGYVGYKEGAKLTDAVKRRPYSVVLFDEIEKAHPQVFHLMLQILEDGYITDATGKKINFKNTIIIMTSNLGSDSFNRSGALGFQDRSVSRLTQIEKSFKDIESQVLSKLKDKFPPEFISRLDKIIVFRPLDEKSIIKITELELEKLKTRLARQNLIISFSPAVVKLIAKTSYTPDVGARAIRKNVQDLIENQIAHLLLSHPKEKIEKITVGIKNNKIIVD